MTMQFLVLATDYDGTLASDGKVDARTLTALEQLRASGRKLVLATGRHLLDLCNVFPHLELFDLIVTENGGVLYRPDVRSERLLCDPPDEHFIGLLREKRIPFSVGRAIVSTWQPNEESVLRAIRELGLDLQVIFNKGAVMVLPSGVNKGTGLQSALEELGFSYHNVAAIGDAENDIAFLRIAGCSVAVANALPSVKERADIVLALPRGEGVTQFADQLMEDDLARFDGQLRRHYISLGSRSEDEQRQVLLSPRGGSVLVAGPSGSGKSTTVAGILEQMVEHNYQFCLIDPEGDYEGLTGALSLGSAKEPPDTKAIFRGLTLPGQSVLVDLLGVKLDDRPTFFGSLLPYVQELRARMGRPHWLIIDEAHHMLPESWHPIDVTVPQLLDSTILITVHPEHVAKAALNFVNIIIAIGQPSEVFSSFSKALGIPSPPTDTEALASHEALVWFRKGSEAPMRVKAVRSTRDKLRHARNYAEGELSPTQSFYFRGPDSKLNLRAQNLTTFLQLSDGIDDATWMYHLREGHYSQWFRSIIKDNELGHQAEQIERDHGISAQESRQKIREAVETRYTAPT
jgi:hydroxymethylpyrimidine pyrophosphatase-like HAD family hydrolase